MKPTIYLCRGYDHTCKSMWCCNNVGGLSKHVICHMFWFLSPPFFLSLFLGSHCSITRRPIFTIYMSHDVFPCKDVPFGGPVVATPDLGDQIPKKQHWHMNRLLTCKILKYAYYQNYCINSKQILHNTKDHQVHIIGGQNTHPTITWQKDAIFEKH